MSGRCDSCGAIGDVFCDGCAPCRHKPGPGVAKLCDWPEACGCHTTAATALELLKRLAATEPIVKGICGYCDEYEWAIRPEGRRPHAEACPLRQAREFLEARRG